MVGNTVVGGRIAAVSSNAGENNSESDLRLTVTMKAGDTLSFDYCVSSGVDTDRFICTVGTKVLMKISGETGGRNTFSPHRSTEGIVSAGAMKRETTNRRVLMTALILTTLS